MIKLNKIDDITFVNAAVTDFADSLGYCEYKIPLSIQGQTIKIGGEDIPVQKYIEVKEDSVLIHQEHNQIVVQKGVYAILQEREWNPFEQQIRKVLD